MISPVPMGGAYCVVATDNRAGSEAIVISPVLTIDKQTPLHDIALQFVEGVTVSGQLLGPDGRPALGVAVSLDYRTPYNHGFGGGGGPVDRFGRFRFEHVNPDLPGDYYLIVRPRRSYQGVRRQVTPSGKPLTIRLKQGMTASGVLIDHETGWPIPNATIRAAAVDYSKGGFDLLIKSQTDSTGRFQFTNMARRKYRLQAEHTVPGTTKLRKNPDGSVSHIRTPGIDDRIHVTGGQSRPVTMRVNLMPDSGLRPVQPESDVVAVPKP